MSDRPVGHLHSKQALGNMEGPEDRKTSKEEKEWGICMVQSKQRQVSTNERRNKKVCSGPESPCGADLPGSRSSPSNSLGGCHPVFTCEPAGGGRWGRSMAGWRLRKRLTNPWVGVKAGRNNEFGAIPTLGPVCALRGGGTKARCHLWPGALLPTLCGAGRGARALLLQRRTLPIFMPLSEVSIAWDSFLRRETIAQGQKRPIKTQGNPSWGRLDPIEASGRSYAAPFNLPQSGSPVPSSPHDHFIHQDLHPDT